MSPYDKGIARIQARVEEIRAIRSRTCEPEDASNPRYHALSTAVPALMKAADHVSKER
jgi:hypothetical protein